MGRLRGTGGSGKPQRAGLLRRLSWAAGWKAGVFWGSVSPDTKEWIRYNFVAFPRRALMRLHLLLPVRRYTAVRDLAWWHARFIVWIDPDRIQGRLPYRRRASVQGDRFLVRDAEWESSSVLPIGEGVVARTMRQLLVEGRAPRETDQYARMVRHIATWGGDPPGRAPSRNWGCRTQQDIDGYFEQLLKVCDSVARFGYRSQAELRRIEPRKLTHYDEEIGLTIGSDGAIYWRGVGKHRVHIAGHNGVPSVPVRVVSIDATWAKQHLRSRHGSVARNLQFALDGRALSDEARYERTP